MSQVEQTPDTEVSQQHVEPGPELFIGVVLPLGVPWDNLTHALKTVLGAFGYSLTIIRLTDELRQHFKDTGSAGGRPQDQYPTIRKLAIRLAKATKNRGMAYLGINRVYSSREKNEKGSLKTFNRRAYCFQSLKRPEEVDALRSVYGSSFICIAAHLPRHIQSDLVSKSLAAEKFKTNPKDMKSEAERLISEENEGGREGGANIKATSSKANFFVDVAGTRESVVATLQRFMNVLFNHPFQTPTPDEQGLSLAHLASLRSAHPQRQVGAALTTEDGSVIAIGCNEVPAPQGGLYWAGDPEDRRDFQFEEYASLALREEVLKDIMKRLAKEKYLGRKKRLQLKADNQLFFKNLLENKKLRDSRLMDAIEYDRTVHAEMAAITDASRRGVSLHGCTLYCTTFPCHNCARHIVAAGIKRVVYIQPYEKSLVERLHDDAISIDARGGAQSRLVKFEHFIGVSPLSYSVLFSTRKGKRLQPDGSFVEWIPNKAKPVTEDESWIYVAKEEVVHNIVKDIDLSRKEEVSDEPEEHESQQQETGR